MDRIIILIDMDCFYVQVEQKLAPEYQNIPCAVVQYKNFKGGGIIAVNYEARKFGIKRGGMHGEDAKKLCPNIHLFQVPEIRGKADLTKYRDASSQIFEVLKRYSSTVERASIDEAYIDVTKEVDQWLADSGDSLRLTENDLPNTFIEGFCSSSDESGLRSWLESSFAWDKSSKRLALAALLCERIRLSILDETGFRCSAGIAGNKMMAKLACGLHKPNKQTLVLPTAVAVLMQNTPIFKIRNFGGHLGGEVSSRFQVNTMGDLLAIPRERLVAEFGEKNGNRIFNVARGVDNELVVSRQLVKSVGCGKNFQGPEALVSRSKINFWLNQMAEELEERLQRDKTQNSRIAELLTVGALFAEGDGSVQHRTRCVKLQSYNAKLMAASAFKALCKLEKSPAQSPENDAWSPPIVNLSLTASKFGAASSSHTSSIKAFLNHSSNNSNDADGAKPKLDTPKSFGAHEGHMKASSSSSSIVLAARRRWRNSSKTSANSSSANRNEDCEISWADDSGATICQTVANPTELGGVDDDDDDDDHDIGGVGDDICSQAAPDSAAGMLNSSSSMMDASSSAKQKHLEHLSESIRSIIRNTLAASIAASNNSTTSASDNIRENRNTANTVDGDAGQVEVEGHLSRQGDSSGGGGGGGSSFFRQKAMEREAAMLRPSSSVSSICITTKSSGGDCNNGSNKTNNQRSRIGALATSEGDGGDDDDDAIVVIDLDETAACSSSRNADVASRSSRTRTSSSRPNSTVTSEVSNSLKRPYYCTVAADSVDVELLKQMPIEIQREYASALGLKLDDGWDGGANRNRTTTTLSSWMTTPSSSSSSSGGNNNSIGNSNNKFLKSINRADYGATVNIGNSKQQRTMSASSSSFNNNNNNNKRPGGNNNKKQPQVRSSSRTGSNSNNNNNNNKNNKNSSAGSGKGLPVITIEDFFR